jgi:galactoside O-acetyltransferase
MNNPFDHGYYTEHELGDFGFASVGKNVRIARNTTIIGLQNISIGSNVRIDDYCIITAAQGFLKLGDYVHIGGNSQLACAGGITINNFSGCSAGVRMYSQSDDYTGRWLAGLATVYHGADIEKYSKQHLGPITLEKFAIIGANSIVLPDVTLGEGVAVGALSLVSKSLDPWGVYFGSPAKRIKNRSRRCVEIERQYLDDTNEQ